MRTDTGMTKLRFAFAILRKALINATLEPKYCCLSSGYGPSIMLKGLGRIKNQHGAIFACVSVSSCKTICHCPEVDIRISYRYALKISDGHYSGKCKRGKNY